MSQGLVLVIDDDEWVGRLLAVALREAGYEVTTCVSAGDGFQKAMEVSPDCIICDVDLPDVEGFWVARKIRTSTGRVSVTPFLFLSGLDDRDTRLQGFHVGADVYMTKPFRIDEVVAQVGALVHMASRLQQHRTSLLSMPPSDIAMVGDLAQMSIATVLTLLDMERRSGKLEVGSGKQRAEVDVVAGTIARATFAGEPMDALDLLRRLLTWKTGRFAFRAEERPESDASDESINMLLMEAVRLEDEASVEIPASSRQFISSLPRPLPTGVSPTRPVPNRNPTPRPLTPPSSATMHARPNAPVTPTPGPAQITPKPQAVRPNDAAREERIENEFGGKNHGASDAKVDSAKNSEPKPRDPKEHSEAKTVVPSAPTTPERKPFEPRPLVPKPVPTKTDAKKPVPPVVPKPLESRPGAKPIPTRLTNPKPMVPRLPTPPRPMPAVTTPAPALNAETTPAPPLEEMLSEPPPSIPVTLSDSPSDPPVYEDGWSEPPPPGDRSK